MTYEELTLAELYGIRDQANDEIQAAYWRFCREARAKPPVLVCPDAYVRRRKAEEEIQKRTRRTTS